MVNSTILMELRLIKKATSSLLIPETIEFK